MSEPAEDGVQPLWLDRDLAVWLHELAVTRFDGDVERAMNNCIRAVMIAEAQPDDPWAAVSWQAQSRSAGGKG